MNSYSRITDIVVRSWSEEKPSVENTLGNRRLSQASVAAVSGLERGSNLDLD